MSNIFSSNIKHHYYKPLDSNLHKDCNFVSIESKEKENALHKSDSDEYKNTIFYSSSKEWNTSVYSYNKSYVKSLISLYTSVKDLFTSYFNMGEEKIKWLFKRRRTNKMRYSANRIYVGSPELKHTNKKISITLYMYNKQKVSFEQELTKVVWKNKYRLKKIFPIFNSFFFKINNASFKSYSCNFYRNYSFFWRLLKVLKLERKDIKGGGYIDSFKILGDRIKLKEDMLEEISSNINNKKKKKKLNFKKLNQEDLLFLVHLLENHRDDSEARIYNIKKIFFNFNKVNRKELFFLWDLVQKSRDSWEERISNIKKTMNFNKLKHNDLLFSRENLGLRSLLEKIFNKKIDIHMVELKSIHLNSDVFSSAVALKLRDRNNKAVRVLRNAIIKKVSIPDLHTIRTFDDIIEKIEENNFLDVIKQQVVTGIRFEASGRLTKRLTAMRAVFKYRYIGSLKNLRSSLNGDSSAILRGCMKSNGQLTMIGSKTRNGAFGLKCWISSH